MKLELSIESSLTQVRLVRAALAGILNDLDVLDDDIILVELAVSELINNVIEHAYQGDTDRRIDVSIMVDSLHLRITVSDTGIPLPVEQLKKLLEPPQYEASSGPDMRCRGRGLQIIRQAVDSVSFRGARGRNIATLEKRLVTRAL
jgi:anti-sigma regulatory factor (Ser/Thr protein kinase)